MTRVGKDGTVEFAFYRRGVRGVRVVRDFASWRGGDLEMADDGDGWWRLRAVLGAGEYRFRYAADGEWFTDYASNGIEVGETGVNGILVVPERGPVAPETGPAKMVA